MTTASDRRKLKELVKRANKLPAGKGDIGKETLKALREATAELTKTEPENFPTTQ